MFILFFCCSAKRIVGRGRNGQGEEPCRVDPFNADNQAEKRTNQEKKTCSQKASLKLNLQAEVPADLCGANNQCSVSLQQSKCCLSAKHEFTCYIVKRLQLISECSAGRELLCGTFLSAQESTIYHCNIRKD